ncbi:hypothetical protein [Tabrizicola sp.]|uniref:hypothetical protein n=1 Tax=Tabrizicola sp. TaxID=2005166 RepID=UPI0026154D86|nr:hypothetical protein [Tabrizicola sp.]MDM7931520.1 hypothetical protein [Tabrizicola sp.]
MKLAVVLCTVVGFGAPALAFEIEEIGTIEATFDGESISQPTVMVRDGDVEQATAFLFLAGAGISAFSVSGYSADNKRLSVEVNFLAEDIGPATAPFGLTISYAPEGTALHWTSEEAPTPPSVTFSTLEIVGNEGRATGTFAALLCYAEGYESGGDPENCRPIEGRFDTPFFVEQ